MRSPVNQSMRSVSWIASPTMGPILFRISGVQAAGMFRRELIATILPILPLGDRLLGHAVARVEAADVADLQNPLGPLGGGDDLAAVFDGRGDRLLEEDMLAGVERGDCRLRVLVPHRDDRDRVDVGIGEQLAVVAGRLRHAEFRRHRLEPIRACACTARRAPDWERPQSRRSGSRRTSRVRSPRCEACPIGIARSPPGPAGAP